MSTPNIPLKLVAGETWEWADQLLSGLDSAYTWACKYVFVGADQFEMIGALSGTTYTFTRRPDATVKLKAGTYTFHRVWDNQQSSPNDDRVVDKSGRVEITAAPSKLQGGVDGRSWASRALEKVEDAIANYSTNPIASISIAGRQIQRPSLMDLIKVRNQLQIEIKRENQTERTRRGLDAGGKVLFRFEESS